MILHFGHQFDAIVHVSHEYREGEWYLGPVKLLQWLEARLGLKGIPNNTAYLRIELYRQALEQYLAQSDPFYRASFEADRFATSETLLLWRDELLQAGWDFVVSKEVPERLAVLATVEKIYGQKLLAPGVGAETAGVSDRYELALTYLDIISIPLDKIRIYEPLALQLPVIQRLLKKLLAQGIALEEVTFSSLAAPGTPLGRWKHGSGSGAGKLAVLRVRRDADAAVFLAQLLRENTAYRPTFLVPEMNLLLEQNLLQEGFAPMGIPSASLARPSLQVLKLAPAFLWEPVDIFKLMEFVTLPVKPLDPGLSVEIARVLAEKPGMFSDTWFAAVFGYLDQAGEESKEQYAFWFDRRRYPLESSAPKKEAEGIYAYLQQWAYRQYENSGNLNPSLLVLAEQARRIKELLETLPEQRIRFLELERIVRTIYEPSPMKLADPEAGSMQFLHHPGALAEPVDDLIWWNCVYENTTPAPDKWQKEERAFLASLGVFPESTKQQSQRHQIALLRPFLQTRQSLLLVIPDQVDGVETAFPLIWSDLEAFFGREMSEIVYDLAVDSDRDRFSSWLKTPQNENLTLRSSSRPFPRIQINHPEWSLTADHETPTQLEHLFYYPHRWFFRQKLQMYRSSLWSVKRGTTLLGSLAHRFFENLLTQDLRAINRKNLHEWVQEEAKGLLPREGATLLLYGREPERLSFLQKVTNAAWNLISHLRNNGWEVDGTEQPLEGKFLNITIKGKADLILSRDYEKAIVDLKWSGFRRRKELIMNEEDLQLILYAKMLPPSDKWPHTAYFILEEGKMIARNNLAFKDAVVTGNANENHATVAERMLEKMEKTYTWRLNQLKAGKLEIRTARTAAELEALYKGQLFELLEMKMEDAPWDDYRTLLGG